MLALDTEPPSCRRCEDQPCRRHLSPWAFHWEAPVGNHVRFFPSRVVASFAVSCSCAERVPECCIWMAQILWKLYTCPLVSAGNWFQAGIREPEDAKVPHISGVVFAYSLWHDLVYFKPSLDYLEQGFPSPRCWESCLPRNWSLVLERSGTTDLQYLIRCKCVNSHKYDNNVV